jgi:hypothetical protein
MTNFLGGEPILTPEVLAKARNNKKALEFNLKLDANHFALTLGGIYSLMRIIQNENLQTNEKILLPKYLCPSITKILDVFHVNYHFYSVGQFEVNKESILKELQEETRIVMLLNYFGCYDYSNLITELKETLGEQIVIVEDLVQGLVAHNYPADYTFNSFRKFIPCDGSLLISKKKIKKNTKSTKSHQQYLRVRRKARYNRYLALQKGDTKAEQFFLAQLSSSEDDYVKKGHWEMSHFDKQVLYSFDLEKEITLRKQRFEQLHNLFKHKSALPNLNIDAIKVPLGYPILVDNRNELRSKLRKAQIYCPIHWQLQKDENENSKYKKEHLISTQILTIPNNNTLSDKLLDILVSNIN